MNKISIIIFALFFLIVTTFTYAHPPEEMIFSYDAKNKILSIGVAHQVQNIKKHFVSKINIKLNGKDLIMQNFLNQTNVKVQAVSYAMVDLKKGDVIEVSAVCNQSGELTKKFKIDKINK